MPGAVLEGRRLADCTHPESVRSITVSFEIIPFEPAYRDPAIALIRIGLREQEAFASQCEPPEDDGFFDAELEEHLGGLRAEPENWLVAIEYAGTVSGLAWKSFGDDRLGPYASVRQIIVSPGARRRGIGRSLLETVEAEARRNDLNIMLISAFRSNPACRLYRSLGFEDFPSPFKLDRNPNHTVLWKCFRPDLVWPT
jgi:GNAT superfamily N-acetyltransferase